MKALAFTEALDAMSQIVWLPQVQVAAIRTARERLKTVQNLLLTSRSRIGVS